VTGPSLDRGIDFAGIREQFPIAETVGRYLELKRRGGELLARCPFHNDSNPSFSVVPRKGKAFCNACHWAGDVIDFVAEYESCTIAEAARRLTGDQLPAERPKLPELPPDEADDWTPVLPAPKGTPAFDPARVYNPRRGKVVNWARALTRCDAYFDADRNVLGYVVRMDIDGQKLTPTVTWARHRDGRETWVSGRFPDPRPLQGLDALAERPQTAVLVVSGEKCREVAARVLGGFVAVTWAGGDGAVLKSNWDALYGRRVTLWPDADASGWDACQRLAARLYGHASEVRIIDPRDQAKGWDIADAVDDGWTREQITEWVRPRISAWAPEPDPDHDPDYDDEPSVTPESCGIVDGLAPPIDTAANSNWRNHAEPATPPAPGTEPPTAITGEIVDLPNTTPADYATANWATLGLDLSSNGTPSPNLDNATAILERHPAFQGRIWFDEFLGRVLSTWNPQGEEREWSDADDVRLTLAIQRMVRISRMNVGTVRDAVTAVAMAHRRNEVQEWLGSIRWDGTPRLQDLLPLGFGSERNIYTEAVGRCWLVSMVARALNPGCKVDTMPVFEGEQGKRKSSGLEALVGSRWFAEAAESPTSKDFFQALNGKLLVEIAEMDAFSRSEVNTIKRVITCKTDRYRAPYGRRSEDHPRMCVFAGTTNKDDWNRDETGARRFWPVACEQVDTVWLTLQRAQLFAEAVVRYQAGEPWWDVPDEDAKREQEARRDADEWEGVIDTWLLGKFETTVGEVLTGALKMNAESWDKPSQMRVAKALKALGWTKETAWRGGKAVKVWAIEAGGKGGKDFLL
jgi:predicted P-loop ATPase